MECGGRGSWLFRAQTESVVIYCMLSVSISGLGFTIYKLESDLAWK